MDRACSPNRAQSESRQACPAIDTKVLPRICTHTYVVGKNAQRWQLRCLLATMFWRESCNSYAVERVDWTTIMNQFDASNTRLGFIGVGAMGSRIVRRLLANDYRVAVYDITRANAEALITDGATVSDSPAVLASAADVILSCLTDDAAVRKVYLVPDGVFAHAAAGTVVIEMSTIRPGTSREVAREGANRGMHVLDVAISGSTPAVEQGVVTLLGGGEPRVFAALEPIFKTIAKQYFLLGPSGSGTSAKLVVNTLLGVGMQAIAEACALGEEEGLDRNQLLSILAKTAVVAPAHVGKLPRAARNDYSPQFPLRLMNKDLSLILETASTLKLALPATEAAFHVNSKALAFGPDQDFSIVIREMESRAQKKEPAEESAIKENNR
jgi:3-hydroxyisobutyrate dehydrogenase